MSSSVEREKVKELRRDAENDEWSKVIQAYKQESTLRTAKITPTGDTVLHVAVSNGVENIVADMVDFLVQEEKSTTQDIESRRNKKIFLGVENDRKDTPLHLAGAMGSDRICEKIGRTDPSLIASRNINGETPLFLAAFYGWRRSFLWLHYLYKQSHEVSSTDFALCIRDNHDNNILHCAIAGGHFDVAIEIVHLYKDHLMRPNKEGLTPLHLLAAKHSAFKTAALLEVTRLLHPFYRCWKVEEKKQATTFEELRSSEYDTTGEESFWSKFAKLVYFLPIFIIGFLLVQFSEAEKIWYCNIPQMKEKHTRCYQIMTKLLQRASDEDMSQGCWCIEPEAMAKPPSGTGTIETPLMIAVKKGAIEMVEKILKLFPSTIKDVNGQGKNILLLAVEHRQTNVLGFLTQQKWLNNESVFRHTDKEGNNALHLAARPGEISWFEFVKRVMPRAGLLGRHNRSMKTPEEIFRESYKEHMKSDTEWVVKTSEACSVVSTLVVSVAFSTRTSVPGGYEGGNGYAVLRNNLSEFRIFRDSSFAALFFSLTSTICFLSIVASSRSQSDLSWRNVASKFNYGICFMFASIVCLWISFCAADFFMLHDHTHKLNKALPTYILLSMSFFYMVALKLPIFLRPIWSYLWSISRAPLST